MGGQVGGLGGREVFVAACFTTQQGHTQRARVKQFSSSLPGYMQRQLLCCFDKALVARLAGQHRAMETGQPAVLHRQWLHGFGGSMCDFRRA